ncbi:MAG: sigma-70 family RNA polymerase sigma factor [Myxococcales bacterium]|nr:sigma-70 family RNA polymerase sigma factor [Myxococcales bacterium]
MQPDWELLERWQAGEARAGDLLLRRYFGFLKRLFRNKVANPDDVADLISESLLACTMNKHRIAEQRSFRSYLFAIALNKLRDYYATRRRQQLREEEFLALRAIDVEEPSLSARVAQQREVMLLVQALRSLPLDDQLVLELRLFEGLTGRAIGELLGLPTQTVHTRLRRGREKLEVEVTRLAENPDERRSTISNLEDWAKRLRAQIDARD